MRLIWSITVLAWLIAGLAPLHAAGRSMVMGDKLHHATCCPQAGTPDTHSRVPDGTGHPACDHASICVGLVLPSQDLGPASDVIPVPLRWQDSARTGASQLLTADPPPPRL